MMAEATFQGYIWYKPMKSPDKPIIDRSGNEIQPNKAIYGYMQVLTHSNTASSYYHKINIVAYDDVCEFIKKNYPLNYDIKGDPDGSLAYEVVVQATMEVKNYKIKTKWYTKEQWRINKIYPCAIRKEDIQELTGKVAEKKLKSYDIENQIEDLGTDNDWSDD